MTYIPLENLITRLEDKLNEVNSEVKKELKINNYILNEVHDLKVDERDIEK